MPAPSKAWGFKVRLKVLQSGIQSANDAIFKFSTSERDLISK